MRSRQPTGRWPPAVAELRLLLSIVTAASTSRCCWWQLPPALLAATRSALRALGLGAASKEREDRVEESGRKAKCTREGDQILRVWGYLLYFPMGLAVIYMLGHKRVAAYPHGPRTMILWGGFVGSIKNPPHLHPYPPLKPGCTNVRKLFHALGNQGSRNRFKGKSPTPLQLGFPPLIKLR